MIDETCKACDNSCKQRSVVVSCSRFKRKSSSWKCRCGLTNNVEYATNKRRLACRCCSAVYEVIGLHIDGRPMIRMIGDSIEIGRLHSAKAGVR